MSFCLTLTIAKGVLTTEKALSLMKKENATKPENTLRLKDDW